MMTEKEKKDLKLIYTLNFISSALCALSGILMAFSGKLPIGILFISSGILYSIVGIRNKRKYTQSEAKDY